MSDASKAVGHFLGLGLWCASGGVWIVYGFGYGLLTFGVVLLLIGFLGAWAFERRIEMMICYEEEVTPEERKAKALKRALEKREEYECSGVPQNERARFRTEKRRWLATWLKHQKKMGFIGNTFSGFFYGYICALNETYIISANERDALYQWFRRDFKLPKDFKVTHSKH